MTSQILINFVPRMTQSEISVRVLVRFTKIILENYFIGILGGGEETETPCQDVLGEEGAKEFPLALYETLCEVAPKWIDSDPREGSRVVFNRICAGQLAPGIRKKLQNRGVVEGMVISQ